MACFFWQDLFRLIFLIFSICFAFRDDSRFANASTVKSNCTVDGDCLHGGLCVKTESEVKSSLACQCPLGWSGATCDKMDSDAHTTVCGSTGYLCGGLCINVHSLCTGREVCPDGIDQKMCGTSSLVQPTLGCAVWERQCDDGSCLAKYKWCDSVPDCSGGEDELYCHPKLPDLTIPTPLPIAPHNGGLNYTNLLIITSTMLFAVLVILIYVRRIRSSQRQFRFYSPVSWSLNRNGDAISMPYHVSRHGDFCHHLPPHRCPRAPRETSLAGYAISEDGYSVDGGHYPLDLAINADGSIHSIHSLRDNRPDVLLATVEMTNRNLCAQRRDMMTSKEYSDDGNDVPPAYSDVIKFDKDRRRDGDETPPPSYEDL